MFENDFSQYKQDAKYTAVGAGSGAWIALGTDVAVQYVASPETIDTLSQYSPEIASGFLLGGASLGILSSRVLEPDERN